MDEHLTWKEIAELIQKALHCRASMTITPLGFNRGIIIGGSPKEIKWLDSNGTEEIARTKLVFHQWTKEVGTVTQSNLVKKRT